MAVSIAMQMNASLASAESGDTPTKLKGMYAGVFVGTGQVDNRIVDVKGFANWGQPGWAVDYNRSACRRFTCRQKVQYYVGGLLVGKSFFNTGLAQKSLSFLNPTSYSVSYDGQHKKT